MGLRSFCSGITCQFLAWTELANLAHNGIQRTQELDATLSHMKGSEFDGGHGEGSLRPVREAGDA